MRTPLKVIREALGLETKKVPISTEPHDLSMLIITKRYGLCLEGQRGPCLLFYTLHDFKKGKLIREWEGKRYYWYLDIGRWKAVDMKRDGRRS